MNKNYIILNNKVNQKDKNGNYINLELDKQAVREYFLNNVNQNTVFFHSLEEKLDYLVENGYYDKKVLDKYTMEEIKEVFKLAYSKKFRFRSYLGAFMFYDRYALRTTDKERILERYEDRLSMIALTIGRNVDEAKEFLNILINRQLQPATPIYMNSGKLRAGSLVSCFDGEERVMTNNGYKKIKDINLGDRVLTHTGNYENVIELFENDYNDKFIELKFNSTINNLKATREHPVYAIKKSNLTCIRNKNQICLNNKRNICKKKERYHKNDCIYYDKGIKNKLDWYSIDSLEVGDFVAISFDNKEYDRIFYDLNDYKYDYFSYYIDDNIIYRKTLNKKSNKKKGNDIYLKNPILKRYIFQSNELGRFIGYYLSEGYIIKNTRSKRKDILGISFTINLFDKYIQEDIINILKNVFGVNKDYINIYYNRDNSIKIEVRSSLLGNFIYTLCGTYFNKKKMRNDLILSNKEFQKNILIGAIRGDGCATKEGYVLNFSNKELIEQMQVLSYRNKLMTVYFENKSNIGYSDNYNLKFNFINDKDFFIEIGKNIDKIELNKEKLNTSYCFYYDNYLVYRIKEKNIEYKKQKVYNIEVDKDHSYTINNFIVHNCFILSLNDDLESIGYTFNSIMKLSQLGGGVGIVGTDIRARGETIKGIEDSASGILPPAKVMEDLFSYVNQLNLRSGSGSLNLSIFHNDIQELINSKKVNADEKLRLKTLSICIVIPDKFMEILKDNSTKYYYTFYPKNIYDIYGLELSQLNMSEWYDKLLEDKRIKKTQRNKLQILQEIIRTQSESGYPYIMFEDNVNRENNLREIGKIVGTNICVEISQIMTKNNISQNPYTEKNNFGYDVNCVLSSLNLVELFDYKSDTERRNIIKTSIKFLSNVSDLINIESVPSVKRANDELHSVGLGVLNLQGLFVKNGIDYESDEAKDLTNAIFNYIRYYSLYASMEIAKERGKFVGFEKSDYASGKAFKKYINGTVDLEVKTDKVKELLYNMNILIPTVDEWKKLNEYIMKYGIYNAYQMAIAPNQSSAYIMEATPSVQPVSNIVEVRDYGYSQAIYPMPYLTNENKHLYKNAYEVDQLKMLDLMAIIQQYVDQAISIVINVKSDTTLKERAKIITYAWQKGIKSLYYWRTQKQSIMANKEPICESCSV